MKRNTRSAHIPALHCPFCGTLIDRAVAIGPKFERPFAGACSFCFKCGGVAIFEGEGPMLTTRKPTIVEQLEIDQSRLVQAAASAWIETMHKTRN